MKPVNSLAGIYDAINDMRIEDEMRDTAVIMLSSVFIGTNPIALMSFTGLIIGKGSQGQRTYVKSSHYK